MPEVLSSKFMLTHAGFFEGIGGFALGALMSGIKTIYACENEPNLGIHLKTRFPNIIYEADIYDAKGCYADIYTAGFPCQDISLLKMNAKGINGEKSKAVFRFMELVRVHRPKYLVIENVAVFNRRGLCQLLCHLAQIGYDAEWNIISKKEFGFPDLRKRCIVVGYTSNTNKVRRVPYKTIFRQESYSTSIQKIRKRIWDKSFGIHSLENWEENYDQLFGDPDGISKELVCRQIEYYGNSICPYIAELIFNLILDHENL